VKPELSPSGPLVIIISLPDQALSAYRKTASASLIVLVVRSSRPFFRSRPSKLLVLATVATIAVTFLVPHLPFAPMIGFGPMPARFYLVILPIVVAYMAAAEITKRMFYGAAGVAEQKLS
jgi:magnesium-transporting ATPase (P-type)